ncbi:MAG TPA: CotH kinase family protein [Clostridia bacterium]|nr:CotH kinase family protein [Clostridia bacterium]
MISSKRIITIIAILAAVSLISYFFLVFFMDKQTNQSDNYSVEMEYEALLFDTDEIISIDILMDDSEWNDMIENAINEEYYKCDIKVNDTIIYSVGIRPKGNTSLSAIASDPENNRYSFKVEFDHYIERQTCFGLDKLILNNNYADATNMKEAVIYDMFQYLGADASLYNYAEISINGDYWGVYLALEAVEASFILRNYGELSGDLYKPDNMDVGEGGANSEENKLAGQSGEMQDIFEDSSIPENMNPEMQNNRVPEDSTKEGFNFPQQDGFQRDQSRDRTEMPNAGLDNMESRGSSGGANLEYVDEELDSYSTIWNGSVTETTESDYRRVVTALQNISESKDIERYLDVDNILKYIAVHSFAVNEDSLSGNMAHNYYLYENDGQLNILPWDYNLSFGGMNMSGANSDSDVVNDPIDTPFSGTTFFNVLLENEEYLARYHEYYQQLVEKYIDGGEFDSFYSKLREKIDILVENDPNAMYSFDEYKIAADMLYKTVKLRSESIKGQLNGTIQSTVEGQKSDPSTLIDATGIDIEVMGTFSMGDNRSDRMPTGNTSDNIDNQKTDVPTPNSNDQQNIQMSQEFDTSTQNNIPADKQNGSSQLLTQDGPDTGTTANTSLIWFFISLVVVIAAFIFAKLYKSNARRR